MEGGREINAEMLESGCRAMEMAEQLRETDPVTARSLERASVKYMLGGWNMERQAGEANAPAVQGLNLRN